MSSVEPRPGDEVKHTGETDAEDRAGDDACAECNGTGVVGDNDMCPACGGSGRLDDGAEGLVDDDPNV